MKKGYLALIVIVLVALSALSGFCFGIDYGYATFEPQIQMLEVPVEKIVEVEKEIEKIVEVEKEIIIKVPVIEEVKVPVVLNQFSSLEELRVWLGEEGIYFVSDNNGGTLKCDGVALFLQNKAMQDGYMMSFQAIYPNVYNSLFRRMRINELHAINSVIIGKKLYYIEPQTREVALGGFLNCEE